MNLRRFSFATALIAAALTLAPLHAEAPAASCKGTDNFLAIFSGQIMKAFPGVREAGQGEGGEAGGGQGLCGRADVGIIGSRSSSAHSPHAPRAG